MRLSNPKILGLCLGAGIGTGLVGGLAWAAVADRSLWTGIGTGWVILGIIAFGIGVIGATEPPGGWATGIRKAERRRGTLKVVTEEHSRLESATSWDLLVWGLVVGGGLIGLAVLAFELAI